MLNLFNRSSGDADSTFLVYFQHLYQDTGLLFNFDKISPLYNLVF